MSEENISPGRDSLWSKSRRKLMRDRAGVAAMIVVGVYGLIAILVYLGLIGENWSTLGEEGFGGMSSEHWFGTNINGQDIFSRAIQGIKTAFEVGLVVAVTATAIGGILGAIAGYFHRTIVDEVIMWLYGCIDAIPFYLFVAAVAFSLKGTELQPWGMHIAMIATFWSSTCRIVRGEVIKIRGLEYIQAAKAVGVGPLTIVRRHVMPNTTHILLVQSTIAFVGAIKSEVILTFLGLGVVDGVSWGTMLSESTSDVLRGHFGNFLGASGFLFILVIAFNMFADALQDALDPKKVSS
ncbi:MAG: ABC transporter permease [Akkermansiaceae bacterium]|nr:ABC transporter permease [Akkermansiaceae bacterium]